MRIARAVLLAAAGLLVILGADLIAQMTVVTEENYGIGNPDLLIAKYRAYRNRQIKSANPAIARISLGYVKGLSRAFSATAGEVAIDLETGKYQINLARLAVGQPYTVWLVDRQDNGARDILIPLIATLATQSTASLAGNLGLTVPVGFAVDRVVVRSGTDQKGEVLAAGSLNVFQRIFFRRLSLTDEEAGRLALAETTSPPSFVSLVPDVAAATDAARLTKPAGSIAAVFPFVRMVSASGGSSVPADVLVSQGAQRFFEKTFGGNGRTCGTCHRAEDNLTIDAAFIATLPANDPLFVAEFNPVLAQLERPQLMRSFGLILENVDGLEDPTNKFTMRGVPHTLGMQVSLETDTSLVNPPADMTGWSGDGAPGTGSLREFAIGAVTQHFTKNLARVEGRDFVLPSEHDLDAMEAFQLSLGRSADFDLSHLTFLDANVDNGKSIFVNGTGDPAAGGRCSACHGNAGAIAANGQNRNFNTNVEDVVHPGRAIQNFPHDGGFGRTANPDGTFGNLTFNTATVVEAADTAPFFHNNVVSTLEGVIGFYTGPEFNNPRAAAARFSFTPQQGENVADFMRAINALDNIRVARRELQEILGLNGNPQNEIQTRLRTAFFDTGDAIRVLNDGAIFPNVVSQVTVARQRIVQAQQASNPGTRNARIQEAIAQLDGAEINLVTIAP